MPKPTLIVRVNGEVVGQRRTHRQYRFALVGTPNYELEREHCPSWAEGRKGRGVYDRLHVLCYSISLSGIMSRESWFDKMGYLNLSVRPVEVAQ